MLLLTALVGLALTFLSPPKGRPTTPADEVIMRNEAHQEAVKRSRTSRRLKVTWPSRMSTPQFFAPACMHTLAPIIGRPHYANK